MSWVYRGKEIFIITQVPLMSTCERLHTWYGGPIFFFYTKERTAIMIDRGTAYDRLQEKMDWLGIDPKSIQHIPNPLSLGHRSYWRNQESDQ